MTIYLFCYMSGVTCHMSFVMCHLCHSRLVHKDPKTQKKSKRKKIIETTKKTLLPIHSLTICLQSTKNGVSRRGQVTDGHSNLETESAQWADSHTERAAVQNLNENQRQQAPLITDPTPIILPSQGFFHLLKQS